MPTLHNPSQFELYCVPLDRHVKGGEEVEITEEQAAMISGTVFLVDGEIPAGFAEDEAPTPAKRTTSRRGTKPVEDDAAPEVETR